MNLQKIINPVLMWMLVLGGIALIFYFIPFKTVIVRNQITPFFSLPLIIYWLLIFSAALKKNRQAPRSVAGISKLATDGIYSRVRHPIYSADIALVWGVFFIYPDLRMLVSAIWMTTMLFVWMKLEEKGLKIKFGDEYEEYKKNTPMFIPRLK